MSNICKALKADLVEMNDSISKATENMKKFGAVMQGVADNEPGLLKRPEFFEQLEAEAEARANGDFDAEGFYQVPPPGGLGRALAPHRGDLIQELAEQSRAIMKERADRANIQFGEP